MVARNISTARAQAAPGGAGKPVVISSANGLEAAAKAMELIKKGEDALDAVIAGVAIV